jgi:hypothetical protein
MKIVKEHIIFEKFTEESDPIQDLGIGYPTLKKFWYEERTKMGPKNISHTFNEFFPEEENLKEDDKFSIVMAVFYMLDYLSTSNSSKDHQRLFDKTIERSRSDYPRMNWSKNEFKKKVAYILNKHFNTNISLNEKFTEDSDPIKDMGIGAITVQLYPNFNTKLRKISSKRILYSKLSIKNFKKFVKDHNIVYKIIKDSDRYNWPAVLFTGTKKAILEMCRDIFEWPESFYIKQIEKGRIKESVNEKFIEDSDPIHDLGIGVFAPKVFKTQEQLVEYVINIMLPYLYNGKIPKDILVKKKGKEKGIIPYEVYNKICDVLQKCKHKMKLFENYYTDFKHCTGIFSGWVYTLRKYLINMGYIE